MDFTPRLGNQAWKMGIKGEVAARTEAKITTQRWSGGDPDAVLYPDAGSSGCGVLLPVASPALPWTLGMAATSSFATNVFFVLLFTSLVP